MIGWKSEGLGVGGKEEGDGRWEMGEKHNAKHQSEGRVIVDEAHCMKLSKYCKRKKIKIYTKIVQVQATLQRRAR